MPAELKSRLPEIMVEIEAKTRGAIDEIATVIVAGAKERVPIGTRDPHLRDAIHTEAQATGVVVVAGDNESFYGHMVEHGTTHSAPEPFLVPALEAARPEAVAIIAAELRETLMVSDKAIRQALYEKLNTAEVTTQLASGSASIRYAIAPEGSTYPLVIFHKQAGTRMHQFGGSNYETQIWLVKAVVEGGSPSKAEEIAKAVDSLLDFGSLTIEGAALMYLANESGEGYAEVVQGEVFHHKGALYRLTLR